jgi:8-oxo-dGTP pyrophosphatase MutT (NUDIX family)
LVKAVSPPEALYKNMTGVTVLLDCNGMALLTRRQFDESGNSGQHSGGAWVFPGGGIDLGETPVMAAQRELREEAGAIVDIDLFVPFLYEEGNIKASKLKSTAGSKILFLLIHR